MEIPSSLRSTADFSPIRLLHVLLLVLMCGCTSQAATSINDPLSSSTISSIAAGGSGHQIAPVMNEELRAELLERMAEDQAARTGVAPPGDNRSADELFAAWDAVDADNAARVREILEEFGWPGWSLVGEDGAEAVWVLVQHADLHLDLQKEGLALLEAAVASGDASPGDLAYLTDRVLVAEGKPQVYGTQVAIDSDGEITPRTPIADRANVDSRRAEVGLGTIDEYYEELRGLAEP